MIVSYLTSRYKQNSTCSVVTLTREVYLIVPSGMSGLFTYSANYCNLRKYHSVRFSVYVTHGGENYGLSHMTVKNYCLFIAKKIRDK